MSDDQAQIILTMDDDQVEMHAHLCAHFAGFPSRVLQLVTEMENILGTDEATEQDGENLAKLIDKLRWDTVQARMALKCLLPFIDDATVKRSKSTSQRMN